MPSCYAEQNPISADFVITTVTKPLVAKAGKGSSSFEEDYAKESEIH